MSRANTSSPQTVHRYALTCKSLETNRRVLLHLRITPFWAHRVYRRTLPSLTRKVAVARAMMGTPVSTNTVKVQYRNASGEQLMGKLVDSGTAEAVVLCHGYMDDKDGFHLEAMATALHEQSLCSLRFDFAGNGESEGTFDFCAYAKEVEDIRASVEYLRQLGKQVVAIVGHSKGGAEVLLYASKYDDVPKQGMVYRLVARSGCTIQQYVSNGDQVYHSPRSHQPSEVAYHTSEYAYLDSCQGVQVVNISGRFNMVKGISERFGEDIFDRLRRGGSITVPHRDGRTWTLTQENGYTMAPLTGHPTDFGHREVERLREMGCYKHSLLLSMQERMDTDMAQAVSGIRTSQVLTIHGSDDRTIPVADAHQFDERIQNHTLHVVQGADHNYTNPAHAEQMIGKVVEWIQLS